MKSYEVDFLSESDSEQIVKLVAKNKNNQTQNKLQNLKQNDQNSEQSEIFKPQKHLSVNMQNKKKLIQKIIKLYYEFFMTQNLESKAEEILHIYKKKLCQQSHIASTLFCWLNDWIGKQFSNFIKTQMNALNKNDTDIKANKPNRYKLKNVQTVNIQDSLINIPQKIQIKEQNKKKFKRLNKLSSVDRFFSIDLASSKEKPQQKNQQQSVEQIKQIKFNQEEQIFLRPRKNLSIVNPNVFFTIQRSKQLSKIKQKDTSRRRPYYSSETSNLIAQKLQKSDDLTQKSTNLNESDIFPINRQIFIGANYEKYFALYKNLQIVIPDLEIQYVKQIKRNDRKKELKKRIKQVTQMFIRTQPLIKTSIDDYSYYYQQKCHRLNKLVSKKQKTYENKVKSIDNSQDETLKINQISEQKQFRLSLKSQRDTPSKNYEKNDTQIIETNRLIQSYPKKRQQKLKETLSLNRPIQLQFNLPRIPDHQKGAQIRVKENSKIVLIQSGRYKVVDSPKISQNFQFSARKNNQQQLSINMSNFRNKNKSLIIESQAQANKNSEETDQRSASILSMITKKKKQSFNSKKKYESNHQNDNLSVDNNEKQKIFHIKSPKINQKQDYKIPKQIAQVIHNLESSDFYTLSGWQKGQQTPVIT